MSSVCVCPLVCVCVWDLCSASLLVESTNGKVVAVSFSLSLGLQVLVWASVDGQEGPGLALLEEKAACNIL